MKRFWYGSACAVVFSLSVGVGELHAQPVPGIGGTSGTSPAVSPYLTLLRNSGNSSAINYFNIVRPQIANTLAIQGLTNDLSQSRNGDQLGGLPSTGHPTQFLNLGGYFLSNGGTGGVGTPQVGGAMRAAGGLGGLGGTGGAIGAGAGFPQR
jgi:hypothetical protein